MQQNSNGTTRKLYMSLKMLTGNWSQTDMNQAESKTCFQTKLSLQCCFWLWVNKDKKETVNSGDSWSWVWIQETCRREKSRERGRASHSCRDGGGWECYLQGSRGQERGFNSLPVSAAGMTKLLSLPSGIHIHPSHTLILSSPVLSSASLFFFHSSNSQELLSHSDIFMWIMMCRVRWAERKWQHLI